MEDVKSCFDDRFGIPASSLTTDASGSSSRTSSWGSSSEPQITHVFTLTFSSEAHARGFFNSGGEVLFTGARSGGTSGSSAGTIGSQLCDTILAYEPLSLILLDHSEIGLYNLQKQLEKKFGIRSEIIFLLGSIMDLSLIHI